MYGRKKFWIQPEFQKRIITFWGIQALLVALCVYFLSMFLVTSYAAPADAELVRVFLRPALMIAAAIGFALSCIAGAVFSHRIAGPVHRIKKSIEKMISGNFAEPIVLRQGDELKDLAASINMLLQHGWVNAAGDKQAGKDKPAA